jgi:hypothetical protein
MSAPYNRIKDLVPLKEKGFPDLLRQLLSMCTPHGHERHIEKIIRDQPYVNNVIKDKSLGNIIIKVGESRSIFSCHMDIVGNVTSKNAKLGGVDAIHLLTPADTEANKTYKGFVYGAKIYTDAEGKRYYTPSTLGADDKLGVFIMLSMIKEKIPGIYIFHTGEEPGGKGSFFLSTNPVWKDLFKDKDRAIAFDRANYGDVIGWQRGGRCCSTKFGKALAKALNEHMPPRQLFKEDVTGSFTDTANYIKLVPECTNISVGYFHQHGVDECFDWYWLIDHLLPAILKVDYEKLPVERDPSKTYSSNYSGGYYDHGLNGAEKVAWKDVDKDTPFYKTPKWHPDLGWPKGASKEALFKGVEWYVNHGFFGKDKEDFLVSYVENLEIIDLLKDEVIAKKMQIEKLNLKLGITKPSENVADIEVHKRKVFIESMVKALENSTFSSNAMRIISDGYIKGATKFLAINVDKNTFKSFTKENLSKMNRLISMMSYLLSCRDNLPGEVSAIAVTEDDIIDELVMSAFAYIAANHSEPGFREEDLTKSIQHIQTLSDREKELKESQPKRVTVH